MAGVADGIRLEDSEVARPVLGDEDAEDAEGEEAGVGPLGWLGFAIMNFAAWGIITTGHSIDWTLGFVICLAYTVALAGIAVCVERRDKTKYHQFVNLLWVLVATFVLVLGAYFSHQVIEPRRHPGEINGNLDFSEESKSLGALLPAAAGNEVWHWAQAPAYEGGKSPSYVTLGSSVFFRGQDHSEGISENILLRIADSKANRPTVGDTVRILDNCYLHPGTRGKIGRLKKDDRMGSPFLVEFSDGNKRWYDEGDIETCQADSKVQQVKPYIREPKWLVRLSSALFFIAKHSHDLEESVHRIDLDEPSVAKRAIRASDVLNGTQSAISSIFLDDQRSALYLRGHYFCTGCSVYVATILTSDGTVAGTRDLRGDVCTDACNEDAIRDDDDYEAHDPSATMWGVLLLGVLPMMAVAGTILATKQLGGLILNLLTGVVLIVLLLWLLSTEDHNPQDTSFFQWFLIIYASLLYVALAAWSLVQPSPAKWQEEAKTWATYFTAGLFVCMLHYKLEVPFDLSGGRWFLFAVATIVQMVFAAIISRPPPMICAAGGLFELAAYVAHQLSSSVRWPSEEFRVMAAMLVLALQGTLIIAAAIYYAGHRGKIERFVRALFSCDAETIQRAKQHLLGA